MDLDREHSEDAPGPTVRSSGPRVIAASAPAPASPQQAAIPPSASTPLLRRCTAVATRARADLLTESRHAASDELAEVLDLIEEWDRDAVLDPDPTMLALAAASLQDLRERLPAGSDPMSASRIGRVVDLLNDLLERTELSATA